VTECTLKSQVIMQELLFDEEDEMDANNNLQRENEELRMNEE